MCTSSKPREDATAMNSSATVELQRATEYQETELHGYTVGYRIAGSGPAVLLLHGITSSADVWRDVIGPLADDHTIIAPDMIGHGRSAKPRGDYSLGAYAAGVRDLLAVLGFERGTVVGHSFGGGIAMQFAYLFPEYASGWRWSPPAASAARSTPCSAPR